MLLNEGDPAAQPVDGVVRIPVAPQAAFGASPGQGQVPLTVQFTDGSSGTVTSWSWSFGDGTGSTDRNPSHTYANPGSYSVSLTAVGPAGAHTLTRSGLITVTAAAPPPPPPPAAAFSGSPRSGAQPLAVQFTDQSSGTITGWSWSFGDGGSSSAQHPSHTYASAGSYTVSLTVSGPGGSRTATQTGYVSVTVPLTASFTASPESGVAPLAVSFTNTSTGAQEYAWFFPDQVLYGATVPPQTFSTPGTHTVRLRAYGPGGTSAEATRTITVEAPLAAALTASPDSVGVGQPVTLTDRSRGQVTGRSWALGDGTSRSDSTFVHTNGAPGTYTVRLSVTGPAGSSSAEKTVVVLGPVQAGFRASRDSVLTGEAVVFTDTSRGLIRTWSWAFGDGGTSTERNPSHTYAAPGLYTVSLTASGIAGTSIASRQVQVNSRPPVISPAIPDMSAGEDSTLTVDLTPYETDDQDSGPALRWQVAVLEGAGLLAAYNAAGGDDDVFAFRPVAEGSGQVRVRFTLSDSRGGTAGQVVTLTWRPVPDPPRVVNQAPADGATGLSPASVVLRWEGSDPDPGELLTYEVRLGRASPPDSLLGTGLRVTSLLVASLEMQRTYYWLVTARDPAGLTAAGPVWRFTTQADQVAPSITQGPWVVGISERQATVQWRTDEAGAGAVEYGLGADLAGARQDSSTALTTAPSLTLAGLLPDTTYYYRVSSRDASGNRSAARGGQFRTLAVPDTLAPRVVAGPAATGITPDRALIQWTTDEASSSQVEFGLRADLTDASLRSDAGLVRQHAVLLTDLSAATTYYYRIGSADAAGNASLPRSAQFRTLVAPDTLGPRFVTDPLPAGITQDQAQVQWTTDEVSSSVVEYGLTAALGLFRQQPESVTQHVVVLAGLLPDTTYHFRAYSVDPSGNPSLARPGQFRTRAAPDTVAPRILTAPVASGQTDQAATVRWSTDEVSDSYLQYGLLPDLSSAPHVEAAEAVTSHALLLTNLRADTTYYYRVRSRDASGNASPFRAGQFRTRAAPDTTAPRFLAGPAAQGITNAAARIEWSTDEDADARLAFGVGALDGLVSVSQRQRQHSVALTNLADSTWYQVQVTASDLSGNARTSPIVRFRTLSAPDTTRPRITGGPAVLGRTPDQVVLEWTTDELSNSHVEFGLTLQYGQAVLQPDGVGRHTVRLAGLAPDTAYYYRVCSTDLSGNGPRCSARSSFRTLAVPDTIAPRILTGPVSGGVTDQSATVRWSTDEASDSHVEYGLGPGMASPGLVEQGEVVTSHAVTLTNLLPDTLYHYRVACRDASGNASPFRAGQFRTRSLPDTLRPTILTGPAPAGVSDGGAQIEWTTDEDADARVEYGLASLDQVVLRAERLRRHSLVLSNLLPDTLYQARVACADLSGNTRVSPVIRFRTLAAPDTLAPRFTTNPVVVARQHDEAVIEWTTNEVSDSEVEYGPTAAYGMVQGSAQDVTRHIVRLTNLEAGTFYHYRASSTDVHDNGPAQSADLTFRTPAAPDTLVPRITAAPVVLSRTEQTALVAWTTDEVADGFVGYGPSADYGQVAGSEEHTLHHEVQLTGLEAASTYHYRVSSTDPAGNGPTRSTADLTFATRAVADTLVPVLVSRPLVTARTQTAATVQWVTDEPADSRIQYGTTTAYGQEVVLAEDEVVHTVEVTDLLPETEYHLRAGSTDAQDNGPAYSADFTLRTLTVPDSLAPGLLSGPTVRNLTATGAVIEWVTDEPATSVVDYGTDTQYGGHLERGELVTLHVVSLTNLLSSTTYHYKVTSADGSGNAFTTDPQGTQQHSRDHTFLTLQERDVDPPVFLEGPVVHARDLAATVEWRTDEDVRFEVIYDSEPTLSSPQREVVQSNQYSDRHAAELTNLLRGSFYYYRVTVWDRDDNAAVAGTAGGGGPLGKGVAKIAQPPGGAGSFVTRLEADTQFPVILAPPFVSARTASSVTIEWETDERSDSFVDFGTGAQLNETLGSASDVSRHRVVLTNLLPGQTYQYQAKSTDPSGNGATRSARLVAATDLELDLVAPRIPEPAVVVSRTDRTATIEWSTDELSTSLVEYGTGALDRRREDPTLTRQHRVTLTNLTAATTYRYRVSSTDGSGNGPTLGSEATLRTDPAPDLAPPRITGTPRVLARTDRTATLAWETDEPADSFVEFGVGQGLLDELAGTAQDVLQHRLTLTNLTPATRYYARVGSVDASNNGPVRSDPFTFTTEAARDSTPPSVPAGLLAQAGSQAVQVTWTRNAEADLAGYNVYRRSGVLPAFELVASLLREPSFQDRGLQNGVRYTYQVTAVDNASPANESPASRALASTPAADQVPRAPAALASSYGDETGVLTVRNATPAAGRPTLTYTFQVSTDTTFRDVVASAARVTEGAGGQTQWRFARELRVGTQYWWRARANDGLFDGLWMAPAALSTTLVRIPGDFDDSGAVDFGDFFLFADHFGGVDPAYDLDGSGRVDFGDFFLFADSFGRRRTPAKPAASAPAVQGLAVRLHVVQIGPRAAVLAVDLEGDVPVKGCGLVLRHAPGVQTRRPAQDVALRPAGAATVLEGILHQEPGRTWYAACGLGSAALGTRRLFEEEFVLAPGSVGTLVVLEEVWVQGAGGQPVRLLEAGRVALLPQAVALAAPYPNPCNPAVHLDYTVPVPSRVRLQVYDILGQLVRTLVDDNLEPGFYRAAWSGTDERHAEAASGLYLVRLQVGTRAMTRKVVMVR
ncbi:MAG: fibronectin type III domain-containing protein [Candidatus Latescibacterota bacterium]